MQEINCPHCGKAFKIDESGYADILKQVRDSEFDQALHERKPNWMPARLLGSSLSTRL